MSILGVIATFIWQHLGSILISCLLLHFVGNYLTPGVRSVPGPFWARFTNLWRFIDVARGEAQVTLLKLHRKHGPYVRLGPNVVSVNDLNMLKHIYGVNKGYKKTKFYAVQQQLAHGKPTQTLFTTLDEDFHARIRRPISSFYSMSGLAEFEPLVDTTIHMMLSRLDEFATQGSVCDMAAWLQYYAFDVIGELTFGRDLGFLKEGRDVDNIIFSIEKMLDYAGKIGQMAWLDHWLIKNPLRRMVGSGTTGAVSRFARERLDERLLRESSKSNEKDSSHKDFLTRFLEAKKTHPEIVTDAQIFSYTVSNINAGSDTTAISLRAVLYYTLKDKRVLQKLLTELRDARDAGRLSIPVSWKHSQELPYFDAIVKEALRVHPAVGLLLERIVPRGGLQLPDGAFLPAGTIVGSNAWVIHHLPVFGEDIDSFVPERWLQAEGESKCDFTARKQIMNGASFTFGAGVRTCIGKNISLLEIYKLIPTLFYLYEMELSNPDAEWELINSWFVRQKHIEVKLVRRRATSTSEEIYLTGTTSPYSVDRVLVMNAGLLYSGYSLTQIATGIADE